MADNITDKENLARYSFTLPSDLMDIVKELGKNVNMNSSQIVREALSNWINERIQDRVFKGEGVSVITYNYNHMDTRVVQELVNIQHNYDNVISSTTHVHLDKITCFELIICKGELQITVKLSNELRSVKGIINFSATHSPH
jgi:CopG family transcriptional regulator, nickel-responsive regulator